MLSKVSMYRHINFNDIVWQAIPTFGKTLLICDDGGDQNAEVVATAYGRMLHWLVVRWHLHAYIA